MQREPAGLREDQMRVAGTHSLMISLLTRPDADRTAWSTLQWQTRKDPPICVNVRWLSASMLAAQICVFCAGQAAALVTVRCPGAARIAAASAGVPAGRSTPRMLRRTR
jgi:hypothetical protein